MHLNGEVVQGCFYPSFPCCVVSQAIMQDCGLSAACSHVVVQAKYQGMCFTAEVALDLADLECQLIVGREWFSLLELVELDTCAVSHGDSVDHHLVTCDLPVHGFFSATPL